jgi:hypothetical protein
MKKIFLAILLLVSSIGVAKETYTIRQVGGTKIITVYDTVTHKTKEVKCRTVGSTIYCD